MEMHGKLMEGLGKSAALLDAEKAGYLGQEVLIEVQKARWEFQSYCAGIAAEFLHVHSEPFVAQQAVRAAFRDIEEETDTSKFHDDEAALVECFAEQIDEAIDKQARRSEWQRYFARLMFRTPRWIKVLIFLALSYALVVAISGIVGK